jgi:hypothetical protein
MSNKNLAVAGFVAFTALSSVLGASVASAVCRNGEGKAEIKLDQTVLSTLKASVTVKVAGVDVVKPTSNTDGNRFLYVNEFFKDSEFIYPTGACTATPANSLWLCNATPTNHPGLAPDPQPFKLAQVCSVPPYQAGNVVTNWNKTTGGSIGLAGAFKIRSDFQNPTLSVRWGKLSLVNTGSAWVLRDNLGGGSIFELTNVKQEVSGGELNLEANLKFGNSDWGGFLGGGNLKFTEAEKAKIVGKIKVELR